MNDPDDPIRPSGDLSAGGDVPRIELAEETATIRKQIVDQGGVRLETVTDLQNEVLSATLHSSRVTISRVPRGEVVAAAPPIREDGNVTIIPVMAERVVLTTELVLVEEVHLIRTETDETVEVPVSLRRQRLIETRLHAAAAPDSGNDSDPSIKE